MKSVDINRKERRMKRIWSVLAFSLLAGCAISTTQDYDTSTNFSRLRTYSWQAPTQQGTNNNTLVDERIRRAVDTQLSSKTYQKVESGQTDFAVTYHYAIQDRIDRDSGGPSVGFGVGGGSRGSFGGIGIGIPIGGNADRRYEEDTLTIDVVDPKNGKLLWRGNARQQYDAKLSPQELTVRFNDTVKAILEKFPPK
jgi:hypothetical protein